MSVIFLHRNIRLYILDDIDTAVDEAAADEMLDTDVGDDAAPTADVELKDNPPSTTAK
jgi:hypothetical protein